MIKVIMDWSSYDGVRWLNEMSLTRKPIEGDELLHQGCVLTVREVLSKHRQEYSTQNKNQRVWSYRLMGKSPRVIKEDE